MNKQYILFDLDGTLTDPMIGMTNSVAYALKHFGIIENDRTKLYKFIGPPLKYSFPEYYGLSDSDTDIAIEKYREYFGEKGIFENKLFPGVPQMLQQLKEMGKKVILATSKPEPYAYRIIEHFGIDKYFDFVGSATMDSSRCKKIDILQYVITSNNITDIDLAMMVGDRKYDIEGAHHFGMQAIGVLYGYGTRAELTEYKADFLAEKVSDIVRILQK